VASADEFDDDDLEVDDLDDDDDDGVDDVVPDIVPDIVPDDLPDDLPDDDAVPDEEEDEDDEEEEASLEVLLGGGEDEDDDLRGEDVRDVLVKAKVTIDEGEFTCRSCFLVKRRAQLSDADRLICLDCD
jgi:hypothetical protein